VIDAFVDAGFDCLLEGVLPDAVEELAKSGALDGLLRTRWRTVPRGLGGRRVPQKRGCLLGRLWIRLRIGRR
jgi:hypothetical protein